MCLPLVLPDVLLLGDVAQPHFQEAVVYRYIFSEFAEKTVGDASLVLVGQTVDFGDLT